MKYSIDYLSEDLPNYHGKYYTHNEHVQTMDVIPLVHLSAPHIMSNTQFVRLRHSVTIVCVRCRDIGYTISQVFYALNLPQSYRTCRQYTPTSEQVVQSSEERLTTNELTNHQLYIFVSEPHVRPSLRCIGDKIECSHTRTYIQRHYSN